MRTDIRMKRGGKVQRVGTLNCTLLLPHGRTTVHPCALRSVSCRIGSQSPKIILKNELITENE
jgi:hypothetical protein